MATNLDTLVVVVLVVLAGCSLPAFPTTNGEDGPADRPLSTASPTEPTGPEPTGTPETTEATPTTTTETPTTTTGNADIPDPPEDRLGWEAGYWYNETLSLTPADGYDRAELDRVVARTMARLEVIRSLEFADEVAVEVISREEYRERAVFEFDPDPFQDQVYEALFLVGEDAHAAERLEAIYNGSVAGYYAGGDIVIVSDDPDSVRIDRATLAHELVHALQDDQFELSGYGTTLDGRMATRGLTEGEANYVMDRYRERCASEWECIPNASRGNTTRSDNRGLFLTRYVPYSDGPTLVGDLVERGGWGAVNRAYERPPASTEQLIHPEKYPDEEPTVLAVEDRSNGQWRRSWGDRERVGEAALYAMFWHNGIIPRAHLRTDEVRHNYSHPFTDGWDGDVVVAYRDGDRYGYVFVTAWDTERDARQFREAYLALLDERGARQVDENVHVIPDEDAYDDAFRVVRRGNRVVVVNGPTVEDLDEIHPPE